MGRRSIEHRARRFAMASLALALTAAAGAGVAKWAIAETDDFYMNPVHRYGTPAYARRQPVADDFWQAQGATGAAAPGFQAATTSTAINAHPSYRSASGS